MSAAAVPRHIPSLDGLRAASVTLVALSHAAPEGSGIPGGFGVTVFFFLSGYLITTLLRAEYQTTGDVSLRDFWIRRALRILPPFYLVLLATTAAALAFDPPGTLQWPAVLSQALHVSNYWVIANGWEGTAAGSGIYWSLAVEEHFYLVFPLCFLLLAGSRLEPRRQALALWAICALVLAWRCYLVFGLEVAKERTYLATDTRFDSILFGCALAVWRNPVLDDWQPAEQRWKRLWLPLALLGLLVSFTWRNEAFRESLRYSLQGAALTVVFTMAVRYPGWWLMRPLNWQPVAFVGLLSYSLYLVHYPLIFAMARLLPDAGLVVRGTIALALSVLVSWLIYVGVERPLARLRRRYAHAPATGAGA